MFRYLLKTFLTVLVATAVAVAALVCVWTTNVCRLSAISGERVFYLDSATSQGLRKTGLAVADFSRLKGESVRFSRGNKEQSAESLADEIAAIYGAKILRVERCDEVVCFYAYTPRWAGGIFLDGQKVNLHVAVSNECCSVGTPIIFDGF